MQSSQWYVSSFHYVDAKKKNNPKGQNEKTRVSGAEQVSGLLLLSLIKVITPKLWCSELGLMIALGWRGFYFGEWKVSDLSSNEPCVNSPEAGARTEDPALIMLHPVGGSGLSWHGRPRMLYYALVLNPFPHLH